MELHLRRRGLYRLTMGTEIEPTSSIEKSNYLNQMDEAYRTICSLISPEILFHISSCKTPNEVWTTMDVITYSCQGQQVAQVHGLRKKRQRETLRVV
jgi:hypothetical protein